VKESKEEFATLRKKLCEKIGADDVMCGYRADTGDFRFVSFYFSANHKPPEDWKILNEQRGNDGRLQCTFAMPEPGSPAAFDMASMGGLMERAARHDSLEKVFGVERFMHAHDAGSFENTFVRQTLMHDDKIATGKIWSTEASGYAPAAAGSTADPITAMALNDKIYFRVPNKPGTGEPIVTPPDAIPVSYEQMLKADADEMDNRRKPSPFDMCWGC
jgi:hypothetical protein